MGFFSGKIIRNTGKSGRFLGGHVGHFFRKFCRLPKIFGKNFPEILSTVDNFLTSGGQLTPVVHKYLRMYVDILPEISGKILTKFLSCTRKIFRNFPEKFDLHAGVKQDQNGYFPGKFWVQIFGEKCHEKKNIFFRKIFRKKYFSENTGQDSTFWRNFPEKFQVKFVCTQKISPEIFVKNLTCTQV